MRKLALLTITLVAVVACGSEAAATTDPQPTVAPANTQPPAQQATAATPTGDSISEQRIRDLEFRLSELERLLSAGDAMFSLTDDLSLVDSRLRAQQRCINALVAALAEHDHFNAGGPAMTDDEPASDAVAEACS